jgi:iron complex transport system ATP-binding protein
MEMKALETKSLTLSYGEKEIIRDLDWSVPKGKITVLLGCNGSGKSTLLRSLARLLRPSGGSVYLDSKALNQWPTKQIAQRLSILPQGPSAPEGLTVLQLVKQGRYPHQSWMSQWSESDESAVQQALQLMDLVSLADRSVDSLSGGQRQRAWIAMTLAQETEILLLDEPTTYLDLAHQIEVLDKLQELNETDGRTIVMVLHDLNLACRYADHIVTVSDGKVYSEGTPDEVVTEDMVSQVFQMDCQIIKCPLFGTPMCVPYGRRARLNLSAQFGLADEVRTAIRRA